MILVSVTKFALKNIAVFVILAFLCGNASGQDPQQHRGVNSKLERLQRLKPILQQLQSAIEVTRRHTEYLLDIKGVVAAATGLDLDGTPVVKVYMHGKDKSSIPEIIENIPVKIQTSGRYYALEGPGTSFSPVDVWPRPVPIGVSSGHPQVSAGTIGARVTDGRNIYALSNNHVFANNNLGSIGDTILQPGTVDGGKPSRNSIGTLYDFMAIEFCMELSTLFFCPDNTIDAALADVFDPATSRPLVNIATPSDGYGAPTAVLHHAYGDPHLINDESEDLRLLLGLGVQKYGRTTALTAGTVEAINATVMVCYDQACNQIARFVDQIIISPGIFSAPGDSGALIVSDDAANTPVALLFAGSNVNTIANRIDRVLIYFGVRIEQRQKNPVLFLWPLLY